MIFSTAEDLRAFMAGLSAQGDREIVVLADRMQAVWFAFVDLESAEPYIRTVRVEPEARFNPRFTQQQGLGVGLVEGYYLADTPEEIWPLMAIALPVPIETSFFVDPSTVPAELRRPTPHELAFTIAAERAARLDLEQRLATITVAHRPVTAREALAALHQVSRHGSEDPAA